MRTAQGASVLLGLLFLAACSSSSNAGEDPEGAVAEAEQEAYEGLLADNVDLDGAEVWVGSIEQDDQDATSTLLGHISIEALRSTGASVIDRTDEGNTFLLRDSLLSGEIDLYWEGAGVVWTGFLREPEEGLDDETLLIELRARDAEEHGVVWLTPAAFESATGFAVGEAVEEETGVGSLTDLADLLAGEDAEDAVVVCVTSGFITFPTDGQVDFEETFEVDLPTDLRQYDPEPIYADTADGTCHFGLVQRTSGRIAQYDLMVLDDDAGLFVPNPMAPAAREDVVTAIPELAPIMATIAPRLTTDVIQELNRRVVVDGDDPAGVARSWLRDEGLIE